MQTCTVQSSTNFNTVSQYSDYTMGVDEQDSIPCRGNKRISSLCHCIHIGSGAHPVGTRGSFSRPGRVD